MAFALGPHARSLGYRLEAFDQIGSTNTEAMSRGRAGERGPLWLVTAHQTEGRGRRSRPWQMSPGNLAASVVESMDIAPSVAATLGFAAGLAAEEALRCVSGQGTRGQYRLKWPNDVLAGSKKLAGILLEAETNASGGLCVVVGIGVNVVSAPLDTTYPATSLRAEDVSVTAEQLFAALSDSWARFRALWDEGRGLNKIRRLWLACAAGVGGPVSVKLGEKTIDGIFETIDDDGRLMVSVDGRLVPIAAGDVYFGAAGSARAFSHEDNAAIQRTEPRF